MTSTRQPYKIMIVAPTCFYYQVELFRELSRHPEIDLTVYFCSPEALNTKEVQQMYNTDSGWGVESELLEGYRYKFLTNYSPFPSYLRSMVGLMNFGIWGEIKRNKPDVVLLMSWMNPVWWLAVLACSVFKVPFLYLTDANVRAERNDLRLRKRKRVRWVRVNLNRTSSPLGMLPPCCGKHCALFDTFEMS